MSALDLIEWLDQDDADFVLLTTFGFDPVFFERRLLRTKALARARRILVLMDANEWGKLVASQEPIRALNQRYLVVPVARRHGVFHPKVGLFLSEQQVRFYCGSTNLTRAGFTFNIELISSLLAVVDEASPPAAQRLVRDAFSLFEQISRDSEGNGAELARRWLEEARVAWGFNDRFDPEDSTVELIHTMDRGLWEKVQKTIVEHVDEILIVSPFWDADLRLLKEFRRTWPDAQIRLVAQTRTSNLDPVGLREIVPSALVESPSGGGRVLHAKLVAWRSQDRWACLVGSANFTDAAWSGRNVEACLLVNDATTMVEQLFGEEVALDRLTLDAFEQGSLAPPEKSVSAPQSNLMLKTAHLSPSGLLSLSYTVESSGALDQLAIGIRGLGDSDPAFTDVVPRCDVGNAKVQLPESIACASGTALRASLIAHRNGVREEGPAIWVVQERRLTVDRGESDESAKLRRVAETGEGLPELGDEVLERQGVHGLIEFLRNTTIRYIDTSDNRSGSRDFAVRVRDPFRESQIPVWLAQLSPADDSQLKGALTEFAERHERQRLRRHAKAGNINGLENYLDILRAVTRLLFLWYRRGRYPAAQLIDYFCRMVELSTAGVNERKDKCPGLLTTLSKNLRADRALLQRRLDELGLLEAVDGILWLARVARAQVDTSGVSRGRLLLDWDRRIQQAIRDAKLSAPEAQRTLSFLERLSVVPNEELSEWGSEILACVR